MARPSVIAHRGASGYLPEHTAEAKAAAHAMGADYLEQDIVASRDGVLLVLHDIYLEAVTDVAVRFPDRARADGHFYVIDFDYAEIAQLNLRERMTADPESRAGAAQQLFADRFPADRGRFRVSTFEAELELIAGLNHSTGRAAGIYPEIKDPAWHRDNGIDLTHLVVTALEDHGYFAAVGSEGRPAAFLQCFDAQELRSIRRTIDPPVPLVQLLTADDDFTPAALDAIAEYAQGIGPGYQSLVGNENGGVIPNAVCTNAHARGLIVHPYTFRRDRLPPFAADFTALIRLFAIDVGIDGLFTDFPDIAVEVLDEIGLN